MKNKFLIFAVSIAIVGFFVFGTYVALTMPRPPVPQTLTWQQIKNLSPQMESQLVTVIGIPLQHEQGWVERATTPDDAAYFTHAPENQYKILFYVAEHAGQVQATFNSGQPILVVLAERQLSLTNQQITLTGRIWLTEPLPEYGNIRLPYLLLENASQ